MKVKIRFHLAAAAATVIVTGSSTSAFYSTPVPVVVRRENLVLSLRGNHELKQSVLRSCSSTLRKKATAPVTITDIVDQNIQSLLPLSRSSFMSLRSSKPEESDDKNAQPSSSSSILTNLSKILSTLTSLFPFFVLSFALMGYFQPSTLLWVSHGKTVEFMLSLVMCGMGLTLSKDDFVRATDKKNRSSVPLGVLCQFIIMPLSSAIIGRSMLLQLKETASVATSTTATMSIGTSSFLGLLLVGCSPGGTASNLVSLIANADVALSVLLTSASTILATIVTPILVKTLLSIFTVMASSSCEAIQVSGIALCMSTARVILFPIAVGMVLKSKMNSTVAAFLSNMTPFLSVLLVSLICGGVVAQNATILSVLSQPTLLPRILVSVVTLHTLGFSVGYIIPKRLFKRKEKTSRTISIETGMQNSALAVVLAKSIPNIHPIALLPGALSATMHSCIGSLLAAVWRRQKEQENSD